MAAGMVVVAVMVVVVAAAVVTEGDVDSFIIVDAGVGTGAGDLLFR